MASSRKHVDGDDLLYRFFRDVLADQPELFASVPQLLIAALGVWLPLDLYAHMPVLLPWVVRDPTCRGNRKKGIPDQWSAPNDRGYMRDDNSMVKSLPRALHITGPRTSHLRGVRMGSEFVASHVWRVVAHEDLASRIPLLNSFVPNLIWLPSQVAKLTDLEGGLVQRTLQAMSYRIYRDAPVGPGVRARADEAWAMIPEPDTDIEAFELDDLNWFVSTPAFAKARISRIETVIRGLDDLARGRSLPSRVITRRYAIGLPGVGAPERDALLHFLRGFGVEPSPGGMATLGDDLYDDPEGALLTTQARLSGCEPERTPAPGAAPASGPRSTRVHARLR